MAKWYYFKSQTAFVIMTNSTAWCCYRFKVQHFVGEKSKNIIQVGNSERQEYLYFFIIPQQAPAKSKQFGTPTTVGLYSFLERFEKQLNLYIFMLYERLFAHYYRRDCKFHTVSPSSVSA